MVKAKRYTLGIDVGTSSTKGVLLDLDGTERFWAASPYGYRSPHPGWAEQDPEDWWLAVRHVVRSLLERVPDPRAIAAVGVSGQGVAATFVDQSGHAARAAILWLDSRATPQAERLSRALGEKIVRVSGKRPAPYNVEPKILWVKEHEPQVWARTRHVMTTTAYVTFCLTGNLAMNRSDAGILLAYDLKAGGWSPELLGAMNIPPSVYGRISPCQAVIGRVTADAARQTGLAEGTPVIAGGEDTSSAGLALGAWKDGDAFLSMGTASTLYVAATEPVVDDRLLTFPHVIESVFLIGGSMVSGGGAVQWLARTVLGVSDENKPLSSRDLEALTRVASFSPAGANGLIFLPYLSGELQPINDGRARGVLLGLLHSTPRSDLVRAMLEGVAFAIRHNLAVCREAGLHVTRLLATGGPVQNELWCQIIADVTGLSLEVVDESGGAPFGDAVLAALGVGLIDSPEALIQAHARPVRTYDPDPKTGPTYDRLFSVYCDVYPRLADLFPKLVAGGDGHPSGIGVER